MKAIILAAGRGSRMRNLTDEIPKCLLKVKGRALFDLQIEALKSAGIKEIAVVTGYKRELLATRGLKEFYNPRWAETNMVSSLACADEWLKEDTSIISYSDIFYKPSAVTSLINSNSALALTYDLHWLKLWKRRFGDPLLDAETFRVDPDNFLLEIGNKPKSVEEIQGQYMGLLKFTPESWRITTYLRSQMSSQERDKMHMTGTLQKIIQSDLIQIKAVPYEEEWGEYDSQEDLLS